MLRVVAQDAGDERYSTCIIDRSLNGRHSFASYAAFAWEIQCHVLTSVSPSQAWSEVCMGENSRLFNQSARLHVEELKSRAD